MGEDHLHVQKRWVQFLLSPNDKTPTFCLTWQDSLYSLVNTWKLLCFSFDLSSQPHHIPYSLPPLPLQSDWISFFYAYILLHMKGCHPCKGDVGKSDLNLCPDPIFSRRQDLMCITSILRFLMSKVEKMALNLKGSQDN